MQFTIWWFWIINWNRVGRKWYYQILLGTILISAWGKTIANLSQDIWCISQDSNQALLKCKSNALLFEQICLVTFTFISNELMIAIWIYAKTISVPFWIGIFKMSAVPIQSNMPTPFYQIKSLHIINDIFPWYWSLLSLYHWKKKKTCPTTLTIFVFL